MKSNFKQIFGWRLQGVEVVCNLDIAKTDVHHQQHSLPNVRSL